MPTNRRHKMYFNTCSYRTTSPSSDGSVKNSDTRTDQRPPAPACTASPSGNDEAAAIRRLSGKSAPGGKTARVAPAAAVVPDEEAELPRGRTRFAFSPPSRCPFHFTTLARGRRAWAGSPPKPPQGRTLGREQPQQKKRRPTPPFLLPSKLVTQLCADVQPSRREPNS